MLIVIEVGVALSRPPKEDAQLIYTFEQDVCGFDFDRAETQAQIFACQWAMQHARVVMPVRTTVLDIREI